MNRHDRARANFSGHLCFRHRFLVMTAALAVMTFARWSRAADDRNEEAPTPAAPKPPSGPVIWEAPPSPPGSLPPPPAPPPFTAPASPPAAAETTPAPQNETPPFTSPPTEGFDPESREDQSRNAQIAKALNIPFFFSVPGRSFLPDMPGWGKSKSIVVFQHPEAPNDSENFIGLRLFLAHTELGRDQVSKDLAASGFVKTGDVILSERPEWSGTGPYPDIQLGISHTAMAIVRDGYVYNIDIPLEPHFLGANYRSRLSSEHYQGTSLLHILRPRGLTEAQRGRLRAWADRLIMAAPKAYPSKIFFNANYQQPNYDPAKPETLTFVKDIARVALRASPLGGGGRVGAYCSELVWALLSLRDCDPVNDASQFTDKAPKVPSCVKPFFAPMTMLGSYPTDKSDASTAGLSDGPLLITDYMGLSGEARASHVKEIFAKDTKPKDISSAHLAVANSIPQKLFDALEHYYLIESSDPKAATVMREAVNKSEKKNYSPTSFLVNTFLPEDNETRKLDYVGTIALTPKLRVKGVGQ